MNPAALRYTDAVNEAVPRTISSDWKQRLPVLTGNGFHLRELRTSDAASLFAMLTTEEVARFISPPPTSVEASRSSSTGPIGGGQRAGTRASRWYPRARDAVGIIQFHALGDSFEVAKWGFALGSAYWGTGLFTGAPLVLDFAFEMWGCAHGGPAVTMNGRGNGALRKMGAVQEATLRQSFSKGLRRYDKNLWSILPGDWRRAKATWGERRVSIH